MKPAFLRNSRSAREPPPMFVCDEQLNPYFGNKSGAKKRLPKKKIEGLEYTTIATSNKYYENYRGEERAEPTKNEPLGKLLRPADPVSGGYKLNYIMDGGPKYEVGTPNPSKLFGTMLLLIFQAGEYLRYLDATIITDSAYGFLEGMLFLSIWGLKWVTSFRLGQRLGFRGISEFKMELEDNKGKQKKPKTKDSLENKTGKQKVPKFSKHVAAWEKTKKEDVKGSSYYWKGTFEILTGVFRSVWLTAVKDSTFCYRLDNFLGPSRTSKMHF